jgi:hypothetical protein
MISTLRVPRVQLPGYSNAIKLATNHDSDEIPSPDDVDGRTVGDDRRVAEMTDTTSEYGIAIFAMPLSEILSVLYSSL